MCWLESCGACPYFPLPPAFRDLLTNRSPPRTSIHHALETMRWAGRLLKRTPRLNMHELLEKVSDSDPAAKAIVFYTFKETVWKRNMPRPGRTSDVLRLQCFDYWQAHQAWCLRRTVLPRLGVPMSSARARTTSCVRTTVWLITFGRRSCYTSPETEDLARKIRTSAPT